MSVIYFLIAFFSTVTGSMTGLGGGVIIKPVLDAIGNHDIKTISILSSFTVFSMAITSVIKQTRLGFKIEKCFYFLTTGAVLGGIIGKYGFNKLAHIIDLDLLSSIQSLFLGSILTLVLFKKIIKAKQVNNNFAIVGLGIILGAISTFLGIGGGPINVAVLTLFIGLSVKDSAVVSILIILFAQLSNLILTGCTVGFKQFDLKMLFFMIPAAIIGGLVGSTLNRKFKSKHIEHILNILLVAIIMLTAYNGVKSLMLYL